MFRRVLIANRGEIAIRVAQTARAMGIRCIGVYSEADRAALHRTVMDESREIGGPLPAQSYLNIDAIVRAATEARDRKSTRLNSSHSQISYAVLCLKQKQTERY